MTKNPTTPLEHPPWHTIRAAEAVDRLEVDPQSGLSGDEATARGERWGPNQLEQATRTSPFKRLLRQFNDILIYVLIVAAVSTALLGQWIDTIVIASVVLINAAVGFIQEGKAEQALDAIRNMLSPKALVLRDGRRRAIDSALVVPGDIVLLGAGDRVPADLRLLEVKNLRIDESALTGESIPVEKDIDPVAADAVLGDRASIAYSSTIVTFGRGVGVVVGTGADTEIGRISSMLAHVEPLTTPLLRQIGQFGRWLSLAIVALAAATFVFGIGLRDYALGEIFIAAISIAVAAIPEGLPAIMTITLAMGVQRMARRNAIIRHLPAVETLGAVTTICSDKTGTLTRNEMTVRTVCCADATYRVSGVGYAPEGGFHDHGADIALEQDHPALSHMLRAALLCNEADIYQRNEQWHMEGDPTEGALYCVALKGNLIPELERETYPRTDTIPFESEHKYMATLHHDHEGNGYIFAKGAPEVILAMCDRERSRDGDRPIDPAHWERAGRALAAQGQRLLALAVKPADEDQRELHFDHMKNGFTMLALTGIIDPPREEAIAAVARCRGAGIRIKMITGDHGVTACAIGAQLGIGNGRDYLTGTELSAMDDAALRRAAREVDIFARTNPDHKLRLVEALQAERHVVAMTGDGVNDAPALKRADVGVSMGRKGTEAAKEASVMVLADDNFASIAHAVEEGRTVYDNLQKAILFILPTNVAQALTIITAILFGLTLPLTPVQVLWVNMVTAVTLSLALAFEPTERGVMQRPPRRADAPFMTPFLLWRVAFVSVLLLSGTFGFFLALETADVPAEFARTAAINVLITGQVFYLFNSRFILEPSLTRGVLFGNRAIFIAVAILIALQAAFTYAPPLQALFGTVPLTPDTWLRILLFGIALMFVVEVEKAVLRHRKVQLIPPAELNPSS